MKQVIMYYIPTGLFVLCSWSSYLMEPTFPARPTLLVTLFLVIVSIFINVIGSTPGDDSGYTALILWILASLFFVSFAFLEYIIILMMKNFCNSSGKMANLRDLARNDRWKLDTAMLLISPALYIIFNMYYWVS